MPIDRFLRSLADECGSRAIGVILSGAGTDGSMGIQAIKAAGGVTFAQDQRTAKFASMPQSAVATNCVDFVLPPERIAAELVRVGRHPYLANAAPAESGRTPDPDDASFNAILSVVHGATGIDFSLYREKTIKRRILRRLALRNIDGLDEYASRLENDAEELSSLQRDLLISVTSFFRDPGSFESLKTLVYPRLLLGRPAHAPIRVWVPGCATGEEAFSIAITLSEYLNETGASFPVQIFASDISEQAIERARAWPISGKHCSGHVRGTPEPIFHQGGRPLPDQQGSARDVHFHAAQPAHRSAVLQAGPGELPQRADLSGQRAEEHHPVVSLRAQAKRFSHVGGLGNSGVPRPVFGIGP